MESRSEILTSDQSGASRPTETLFHSLNYDGVVQLGAADRHVLVRQLDAGKRRHQNERR